jgi:hypothetical protein
MVCAQMRQRAPLKSISVFDNGRQTMPAALLADCDCITDVNRQPLSVRHTVKADIHC